MPLLRCLWQLNTQPFFLKPWSVSVSRSDWSRSFACDLARHIRSCRLLVWCVSPPLSLRLTLHTQSYQPKGGRWADSVLHLLRVSNVNDWAFIRTIPPGFTPISP